MQQEHVVIPIRHARAAPIDNSAAAYLILKRKATAPKGGAQPKGDPMLPKPSVVLQVKLVPDDYSAANAAEIKRSFMYMAQSVVSEAPEDEQAEGNVMRMSVRLMKPYWNDEDEGARELWRASFMPWLANLTRNMSTAMHNYNTVLHPLGSHNVTYQWADYDFAPNGIIRVKVDDENRIPSEMPQIIDQARTLLSQGAFGEGVQLIRVPSRASIEAQQAAWEEARRAAEVEEAEEAAEVVAEAEAILDEAAAAGTEADEVAEGGLTDGEVAAEEAAREAVAEAEEAETADAAPAAPAAFVLDLGTWGIEYADGRVEEFDSRA